MSITERAREIADTIRALKTGMSDDDIASAAWTLARGEQTQTEKAKEAPALATLDTMTAPINELRQYSCIDRDYSDAEIIAAHQALAMRNELCEDNYTLAQRVAAEINDTRVAAAYKHLAMLD